MAELEKAAPETPERTGEDAALWADLAKELETEEGAGEPQPAPHQGEAQPDKAKEGEPKLGAPRPKPSYEDLETHSRRTSAALREARERERAATERLNGIVGFIERERAARQPVAKAAEPAVPDVNEDPIGHFQALLTKAQHQIEELKTGTAKSTEHVQAQLEEQRFWNAVQVSEQEIVKTVPDYWDACMHLENGRRRELEYTFPDTYAGQVYAQQFGMTPQQLRDYTLNQERTMIAEQAMRLGVSPAQRYYDFAKMRGYQAKAGGKPNGQANGKLPADPIAVARKGFPASKSISGGEGGKDTGDLSVGRLTDLYTEDPEEADRMFDRMAKAGLLG